MSTFSWDRPKDRASSELHRKVDADTYRQAHEAAYQNALDRLREAETGDDAPRHVAALQAVAGCDERVGDYDAAEKRLDDALARAGADGTLLASTHLCRSSLCMHLGDAEIARTEVDQSLRHASASDAIVIASLAYVQSGILRLGAKDANEALSDLDQAFSLGRDRELTGPKGRALSVVGSVCEEQGDHAKALEVWDRARLLHSRADDSAALGSTYNNVGVLHYRNNGAFASAIPFFERALEILVSSASVVAILATLNNNVRTFESHYFDRAGLFRDEMAEFVDLLHNPQMPRFHDLGLLRQGGEALPSESTYASDLVVADPVLVLPTYPPEYQ